MYPNQCSTTPVPALRKCITTNIKSFDARLSADKERCGYRHLPSFTVTVEFDDTQATSPGDAGSIKEAKEQACMVLAARILARNARRITH